MRMVFPKYEERYNNTILDEHYNSANLMRKYNIVVLFSGRKKGYYRLLRRNNARSQPRSDPLVQTQHMLRFGLLS
jgi:hypothetical protein